MLLEQAKIFKVRYIHWGPAIRTIDTEVDSVVDYWRVDWLGYWVKFVQIAVLKNWFDYVISIKTTWVEFERLVHPSLPGSTTQLTVFHSTNK